MSIFTFDVTKWARKANGNVDAAIRKIAFDMGARIIMRTPVRTGRARANWMFATGSPNITNTKDVDPYRVPVNGQGLGRAAAKDRLSDGLASYSPRRDKSLFLTNSLPYIGKLEYGHSQQAPAGMVRVTLTEFAQVVQGSVVSVRAGK